MKPKLKSAVISAVRWILVIPAMIAVTLVAKIALSFFNGDPLTPEKLSWLGMIPFSITTGVVAFLGSLAAVYVAPFWEKAVAITITTLAVLGALATIYLCFRGDPDYSWKLIFPAIAGIIGSYLAIDCAEHK